MNISCPYNLTHSQTPTNLGPARLLSAIQAMRPGKDCVEFDAVEPRDTDKYYYKQISSKSKFNREHKIYELVSRSTDLAPTLPSWSCNHDQLVLRVDRIVPENDDVISIKVLQQCELAALRKLEYLHNIDIEFDNIDKDHVVIKQGVMERGEGTSLKDYVHLVGFGGARHMKRKATEQLYKEIDVHFMRTMFRDRIAARANKEAKDLLAANIAGPSPTSMDVNMQKHLALLLLYCDPSGCPLLKPTICSLKKLEPCLVYAIKRAFATFDYTLDHSNKRWWDNFLDSRNPCPHLYVKSDALFWGVQKATRDEYQRLLAKYGASIQQRCE